MKDVINAKAFANAAATVMAVWVVACAFSSYIAPDLLFTVAKSWMHNINLDVVRATFTPDLGSIVFGLITASGLTWVTVYGVVSLYNRWKK